ncbi:hypothetical protein [Kitasatospora sp. NPDC127116]
MYPNDDAHPEPGGPEWQATVAGLEDLGAHIRATRAGSPDGEPSDGSPST